MLAQGRSGSVARVAAMVGLAIATIGATASPALAHCDSMDGPVVTAARKALESGSVYGVLIWVRAQDEAQVKSAFQHTLSVRKLGPEARQLADYYFFETVVRLHREGEGEPYTGLKPAGTDYGKAIPAADRAIESGSAVDLEALLVNAIRGGVHERFERVLAARAYRPDDVEAGRRYVAAYVALLHYVEAVHAIAAGGTAGDAHGAVKHGP